MEKKEVEEDKERRGEKRKRKGKLPSWVNIKGDLVTQGEENSPWSDSSTQIIPGIYLCNF